jgi:hypothetical protein
MHRVDLSQPNSKDVRSPFFSRAYGGFTRAQEAFYREMIGDPNGKLILDPMAGQGFALSTMAHSGAMVWLGDIDPAPLLLAGLRDPTILRNAVELVSWANSLLRKLSTRRRLHKKRSQFHDGWVAPGVTRDLQALADLAGLGLFSNPFQMQSDIWQLEVMHRFIAGIVVLAARDLACYRSTDNVTWLKPGGLIRHERAILPLKSALRQWETYARGVGQGLSEKGAVIPRLMNVAKGECDDCPKVPWIITSPPYANRLDYTRLWGPELNVLMARRTGLRRRKSDRRSLRGQARP